MNEKFDAEEFKMACTIFKTTPEEVMYKLLGNVNDKILDYVENNEVKEEEISKEEAIKMLKTINDKLEDIIKELNKRD